MVETDFLSCGDRFLLFNLVFFFYKREPSLKLMETNLFGKDFVPVKRDVHQVETVFFYSVLLSFKWKQKLVEISSLHFL